MSDPKITFCFPGGAGGNWLSNLIYCLENNVEPVESIVNFHGHKKSKSVKLIHDVTDKSNVFFNGKNLFNIYLNVVIKLRMHDQNIDSIPTEAKFDLLASEASSKLFFLEERTDLSWDDLFLDEDRFISTLCSILDANNINYTPNISIFKNAIRNYRASCVDPADHFDNFDSIYWLGWCHGVNKHLYWDFPVITSMYHVKDLLLPKRKFFKEFTNEYVFYYQ